MKSGTEYLQSDTKRTLDLIGGTTMAVALAPVGLMVGTAAALDSKMINPLFLQERTGGPKESIMTYKFRTLTKRVGSLAAGQTVGTFDPRASAVGQRLRQSGLDELPQLLNVLQGDMSLVGPRPLTASDIDKNAAIDPVLFDEWYTVYRSTKPGLTGNSQIYRHHYRHASAGMMAISMRMDIDYAETASLQNDLRLIAQTPLRLALANIGVEDVDEQTIPASAVIASVTQQ